MDLFAIRSMIIERSIAVSVSTSTIQNDTSHLSAALRRMPRGQYTYIYGLVKNICYAIIQSFGEDSSEMADSS